MKKILEYKNLISLVIMIIVTTATQILTLMKSSMVAGMFGTSIEMDAYNFANSIVSFLFGFIASGISTVIIPYYIKKENNNKYIDSFITILYGFIAAIVIIFILFRFKIIGIFSNRDEMFINISCNVLIILLLANFLLAISDVTVAYFQCNNKYNLPKVISLISQILVIIMLMFVKNITIIQYSFIIAFGLIFNFVFDTATAIKLGWKYRPSFMIKSKQTKELLKLFIPIVFSTGIYKISLLFDSVIAARLDTGKITVLSYSSQIVNMVNTILTGTLLTYSYPKIVRQIKVDNNQKLFWEQTTFFHLIVCLVITCLFNVGQESVAFLFQHGKFTTEDTLMVFTAALIYIFGQQTNIIRDLVYRYFYAKGNTSIAAKNSIMVSVINIIVSIILVNFIGFYGIVYGTIIASFISLIAILKKFSKSIGFDEPIFVIIKNWLKNILISFFTIAIVQVTKHYLHFDNLLLEIVLFGMETIIMFGILVFVYNKNIFSTIKKI